MRLGVDVSTYFEEMEHGAKYFDGEREVEPLDEFRANGVDLMRIRLWVDPKSQSGEPYLAGNCDLENFFALAEVCKQKGYGILLDFHYSDFWCDPGKQFLPKAWRGLTREQLIDKVYEYTSDVLMQAKKRGVDIEYIQVGNEITNGILWPYGKIFCRKGKRINYKNLSKLLQAGCKACREIYPKAKIMLHLERSYDQFVYNEFFTYMTQVAKVDFDVIGLSYYPHWHGTFEQLFDNIEMCKKFDKELMIVETGYAFTYEDYLDENGGGHLVANESDVLPKSFAEQFPVTAEGQEKFTKYLLEQAELHGVSAVVWWEPLWIPGENICWASEAGEEYLGEQGKPTRNDWANQCLFDYHGRTLPAFDAFKARKK